MATSISITITATRALTVEGRLVAGETAEVTIGGVTPTALYLVAPDQTVVAACESFTPMGQGSGGVGFLQLATEQIAALFAHTPAGRMVAVWALVNDADGVAGAGWIPVVSAPMPDELVDLDIDFYLRASQIGSGLAIVDGKLVCTISPDNYLTKTEAAQTYAAKTSLATVATTGSYDDLIGKPTIPTSAADVGALPATAGDVGYEVTANLIVDANISAIRTGGEGGNIAADGDVYCTAIYIKGAKLVLPYAAGETITASSQLADRTGNRVVPTASNTADIVLTFPAENSGYLRDFLVLVTNTVGNTGNITFSAPIGSLVYGDGFTHSAASGETWLYSVTEVAANTFWAKSVKMEVAQ